MRRSDPAGLAGPNGHSPWRAKAGEGRTGPKRKKARRTDPASLWHRTSGIRLGPGCKPRSQAGEQPPHAPSARDHRTHDEATVVIVSERAMPQLLASQPSDTIARPIKNPGGGGLPGSFDARGGLRLPKRETCSDGDKVQRIGAGISRREMRSRFSFHQTHDLATPVIGRRDSDSIGGLQERCFVS